MNYNHNSGNEMLWQRKIVMLITLFFLFNLNSVHACFCGWKGGLVKTAQAEHSTVTIHGKVSKEIYTENRSYEIEVLSILKGDTSEKIITVLSGECSDCINSFSNFHIGTEWVLVLHKVRDNRGYIISSCGEYITPVKDNRTWGYILYNDKCTIDKPMNISLDSLQLAIDNPKKYVYPTRSCRLGENKYFIDVNHIPMISKNHSVHEFLREKLNITDSSELESNAYLLFTIFFDEKGIVEKIDCINKVIDSTIYAKYGDRIIALLKEKSPWIPANHWGENIPMKLKLEIKFNQLIK